MSTLFTIRDIIAANRSAGQHYFSPAAMRRFRSRVLTGVAVVSDGSLFVTSEADIDGEDRRYSVRFCYNMESPMNGHIENVSAFRQYATIAQARGAMSRAARDWTGIDNV